MTLNAYELSAGLFVRGLLNLKAQLAKAEAHVGVSGRTEAAVLNARLATPEHDSGAASDLHRYTLGAHVHWAAEGAHLAIAQLLGEPRPPAVGDAASFAALHQRLDATIAQLRAVAPDKLEAGLDRQVVIEHRRGSARASGRQFLVAFAIPHFGYHLSTAYGILRNQGVPLTMGDFLGDWTSSGGA